MTTWIALLRGINVGGNNKIKMADLRESLASAGFANVQTYIQSGNVVFEADGQKSEVRDKVMAVLSKAQGIEANVMVISPDDLRAAIEANPFAKTFEKPNWMFTSFLESIPDAPDMAGLETLLSTNEKLALKGDVFYFYAGDGAARSKVMVKAERYLGVSATARNWNTLMKLKDMIGETNE